jgi:UDP-N-acetylglucosamine 2-epimerase (non-hydrolysing)
VSTTLVHTGQHYDERMSDSFFRDLRFPQPDADLGVGSGTHGFQTAEVLTRFENYLQEHRPDLVVVVGDVNSTLAAALAAVKLHIPVAHVESGLRSKDRRMPEEINRILTDRLAALLFVTEQDGVVNLEAEGVDSSRIHRVGNSMIDSLLAHRQRANDRTLPVHLPREYGLITLHRPSNVDDRQTLSGILEAFEDLAATLPLLWPMHPRTEKQLAQFDLSSRVEQCQGLQTLPPCGYLDFLAMMDRASLVLTDSGGIQEEALVLRVPVVTLRDNTERPSTVDCGGNLLVGSDPEAIRAGARQMLARNPDDFQIPELWDGKAGVRIAEQIVEFLSGERSL